MDTIVKAFPPLAAASLLVAAAIIFIVGFSRRGLNFIKYGFGKIGLDETFEKRFDHLEERLDGVDARLDDMGTRLDGMDARLDGMDTRLNDMGARLNDMGARLNGMDERMAAIETNHFGHLKEFLTELTSILLDKDVINNQDKARLDNKLRGM